GRLVVAQSGDFVRRAKISCRIPPAIFSAGGVGPAAAMRLESTMIVAPVCGWYAIQLLKPNRSPLCPRNPAKSITPSPYLKGFPNQNNPVLFQELSRCCWVAALSNWPVARALAQICRSCSVEIAPPAVQPQDGFQSVTLR